MFPVRRIQTWMSKILKKTAPASREKRGMRFHVVKWIFVLGLIYLGFFFMLLSLETSMIYPMPEKTAGDWMLPQNAEEAFFTAEDGTRINGRFFHRKGAVIQLLFCHGNGEHLSFLTDEMQWLSEQMNANVLAFDYRGYGKSEGMPSEVGIRQDVIAAMTWLNARTGTRPDDVVAMGRSLGGAVAIYVATESGAKAVIAERTFSSMVDVAADKYRFLPVRWLMKNRYESMERIRNFQKPFLVMHGADDQIVPIRFAQRLYDACPGNEKKFIELPGIGHNDLTPIPAMDEMIEFVKQHCW